MANLKAANVTKYDAGGSGDNCIGNGLIKSVEKVWIDSYAFTAALATTDSICIGVLPKGAHLTEVEVYMPAVMTLDTLCTIYLCTGASVGATSTFFGSMKADGYATTTFCGGTAATLRINSGKFDVTLPTDATTKIYMTLHPSNGKSTVVTAGTIRSIIRYT